MIVKFKYMRNLNITISDENWQYLMTLKRNMGISSMSDLINRLPELVEKGMEKEIPPEIVEAPKEVTDWEKKYNNTMKTLQLNLDKITTLENQIIKLNNQIKETTTQLTIAKEEIVKLSTPPPPPEPVPIVPKEEELPTLPTLQTTPPEETFNPLEEQKQEL